jgi:hypothetical protein
MGFVPAISLQIEMLWAAYQEDEKRLGAQVTAARFVRDFVAQNFPEMTQGAQ